MEARRARPSYAQTRQSVCATSRSVVVMPPEKAQLLFAMLQRCCEMRTFRRLQHRRMLRFTVRCRSFPRQALRLPNAARSCRCSGYVARHDAMSVLLPRPARLRSPCPTPFARHVAVNRAAERYRQFRSMSPAAKIARAASEASRARQNLPAVTVVEARAAFALPSGTRYLRCRCEKVRMR